MGHSGRQIHVLVLRQPESPRRRSRNFRRPSRDRDRRPVLPRHFAAVGNAAQVAFRHRRIPDRFELVDKGVKDDEQRLDRAQHLSETIADLEWFGLPTAAETLVPLLRSDLQSLWPGKSLDWAKLALPDLRRVLQILIELRSPPPSAQEHEELAPQESEEPPPQQRHVWRRAV